VAGRTRAGRAAVEADDVLLDSVLRRLEILADAAGRLSPALQARHPDIPWARVVGFRNWLAHGYRDLNLDLVWEVIEADLPRMRAAVEAEMAGES
jgi:uncharacterized protein with HEPN domain